MKILKVFVALLSIVGLVSVFQNCGQPGYVSKGSSQVAKLSGDGVDGDDEVPVDDVVDDDDKDGVCEDDVAALLIKEVKAPSASQFSSHLFDSDPNLKIKIGANSIPVVAKGDAIKIDKLDLILSEKYRGMKIRMILDRNDYAVKKDGKYLVQFNLKVPAQDAKSKGHSCQCRLEMTDAKILAQ